jgi:hypothetical protein
MADVVSGLSLAVEPSTSVSLLLVVAAGKVWRPWQSDASRGDSQCQPDWHDSQARAREAMH